jgi:hypothetical protein
MAGKDLGHWNCLLQFHSNAVYIGQSVIRQIISVSLILCSIRSHVYRIFFSRYVTEARSSTDDAPSNQYAQTPCHALEETQEPSVKCGI